MLAARIPPVRRVLTALLMVALVAPPRASAQTGSWQAQVQALLTDRASAVQRGDEPAFLATMRGAPAPFVQARRAWFERLRTLPLGSYTLTLHQDEFGDLSTPADGRRYGGDVHIVQVKEQIAFRGYDRAPADEDLFLTVRNDGRGWSVVSDTDRESLFLVSMRNLWDFGPIQNLQSDGIMVVYHPAQASAAPKILSIAKAARSTAMARWPYRWSEGIIIMVPSTVAELARILQTQFDLSAFVAFASSSVDRDHGWALVGDRVFLHWPNFSRFDATGQQTILDHEFTHIATRAKTSPFMPAWMDEGIAQFYGEAAGQGPRPEERQRVHAGTFPSHLPDDWQFSAPPNDDIYLSYELSLSFMAYIADRFGHDAGARVYEAIAAENQISPGTSLYHVEQAYAATFHSSLAALEAGWSQREIAQLR
jgi:hypothetical protein